MTSQPPARPLIVTFALGPHRLGLAAGDLREVVFLPDLVRAPGLPAAVEGFADLRGDVLPVVRLDRLLGLEDRPLRLYTPLLVLAAPRCALLADRVCDLVEMEEEARVRETPGRETLAGGLAAAVAGAFRQEGLLVHLLAPARLMGMAERRILDDLAAAERRRRALWEGMVEGEAPCG